MSRYVPQAALPTPIADSALGNGDQDFGPFVPDKDLPGGNGALAMRDFFRKYIFNNLWLKLVSLAMAFLLWWAVGHDPTVEAVITAPLEFHHAPAEPGHERRKAPPRCEVRVRGPERTVRRLSPADVQAILDLPGASAGRAHLRL